MHKNRMIIFRRLDTNTIEIVNTLKNKTTGGKNKNVGKEFTNI